MELQLKIIILMILIYIKIFINNSEFQLKNETLQHIIILHGNVIVSVLESDYLTCLMNLRTERSRKCYQRYSL